MSLNTVCLQVLVFWYFLRWSAIQKKLRELSCVNFIINGLDLRNIIKCHQVQCYSLFSFIQAKLNQTNRPSFKSKDRETPGGSSKRQSLTFLRASVSSKLNSEKCEGRILWNSYSTWNACFSIIRNHKF